MQDQIAKYSDKLIADRAVIPGFLAVAAQDDVIVSSGHPDLAPLAEIILAQLNSLAIVIAPASPPFSEFLIRRADPFEVAIVPRDTETRTFLHDIPILRKCELGCNRAKIIAKLLGSRKGIVVEGIGIIAVGALTVEQAYINWHSVYHSTYIKFFEDLLLQGYLLTDERGMVDFLRNSLFQPLNMSGLMFRDGPFPDKASILDEMAAVGSYTVRKGLVDSFFGNISYRQGDLIYISQTASSLDELSGCIDPVPFTNSSTVGITASSELGAHRGIYESISCLAILHGHPKFAVIMSMQCDEQKVCQVTDCWRDCKKVRLLGKAPVVAGEIGAGGLARSVPPVIGNTGVALVYGHGVFAVGSTDFKEAFERMIEIENWCRTEYFSLLDQRWG